MAHPRHEPARGRAPFQVAPVPAALLDTPLDYIWADHFRQRGVIEALKRFAAQGLAPRSEADSIIAFLTRDLPWHHDDEDEDLFPLLRKRAQPEDEIGWSLARLTADHAHAAPVERRIVEALAAQPEAAQVRLNAESRERMGAYAASEHRHLAIENGIVLAIARIRLTRTDLHKLSAAMTARRAGGVDGAHT